MLFLRQLRSGACVTAAPVLILYNLFVGEDSAYENKVCMGT